MPTIQSLVHYNSHSFNDHILFLLFTGSLPHILHMTYISLNKPELHKKGDAFFGTLHFFTKGIE